MGYDSLSVTTTQKLNGDLRRGHKEDIMDLFKSGYVFEI